MVSVKTIGFVVLLFLLQPLTALCDFLSPFSPLLAPIFDDVCKEVGCGKGKCKPSQNSSFFYECECDAGWKQSSVDFKFLPCIVPNCSINYACTATAPAPVQEKATKANESILDICRWTECGGGSCNKTSAFTYDCICEAGYYNLLNATSLPCFKECAIGMDCSDLGISMPNTSSSTSTPPSLADNGNNQGGPNLQLSHLWLLVLMISLSMMIQ